MILVYNIIRRGEGTSIPPYQERNKKMARTVYYFDMDGVIANFHKEPFKYANATNREWIANLDPFMENVKIIRDLLANKKSVYILTKAISEEAKQGKLDWIARYIPELDTKRVIVIVGNGKKVDYMRTKTGVLIDDDIKNTRQWEKAGHKAITLEYKGQTITL
jgi:5'(3')-deoxyribonucleotidase